MLRPAVGALVLALSPAFAPAPAFAQDAPRKVEGELGSRIAAFAEGAGALGFSGTVLAARGGKVVAALGVGHADLEGKRSLTASTLFEIASVTKQFTAAAVLVLVQQKKLKLDDPIARHLPGIPENCGKITVRHLLQHTSGIPGSNARGGGDDLAAVLPSFLEGGPRHEPGTHWEYWNQGYALLAAIIERRSGDGYAEFCKRELFAKAGLRSACFTGDAAPKGADVAIGVSPGAEPRSALAHPYGAYGYQYRGMGGAVCNVWDLWRWDRALRGTAVLKDPAKKELFAPGPGDYALGWFVREENGRKVQQHGGGVRGFICDVRRWPEEDAFLCVLSNRGDGPLREVVSSVETILFGGAAVEVPPPLPVAAGKGLVGTWTADGRRLVIREQAAVLRAELHWGADGPVTSGVLAGKDLDSLQFFDWSASNALRVERGDGGAVASLQFGTMVFRRAP